MRYRCRACLKRGHNRVTCPEPLQPGKYYYRGRWRSVDGTEDETFDNRYHGLDEYILKHVGRVPVTSQELFSRVVNDYGPVGERTFLRHLRALRAAQALSVAERPLSRGFLYAR